MTIASLEVGSTLMLSEALTVFPSTVKLASSRSKLMKLSMTKKKNVEYEC